MTLRTFAASALAVARMVSVAFVGVGVTSTAACSENCEVTRGLYEPYVAAVLSPETFDGWLDDHPGYFTRARVSCLIKKEEGAYARERELLRACDAYGSDPDLLDICRRGIQNPEDFTTFWVAVLAAAQGTPFLNTGVGAQLYSFKLDDPAYYTASMNSILQQVGPQMEKALECEKCTAWYKF